MRRVLATAAGAALYRRRPAMIEPVFADTKFNRRTARAAYAADLHRGLPTGDLNRPEEVAERARRGTAAPAAGSTPGRADETSHAPSPAREDRTGGRALLSDAHE